MDELRLYPREEPFDPLGVMLFKALQVIAFLFFIALLSVSPDSKDGKIDSKAEFIITMDWPDSHPDDLDLFVQDPAGNIAWYRHRARPVSSPSTATIAAAPTIPSSSTGKKIASPIREEIVTVRGIVAGEYTVNVSHFQGHHRAARGGERESAKTQSDRPGDLRQQADARPHRRGKDCRAFPARRRRQGVDVHQRSKSLLETFRNLSQNGADLDPKTGVRMPRRGIAFNRSSSRCRSATR